MEDDWGVPSSGQHHQALLKELCPEEKALLGEVWQLCCATMNVSVV